MPYTPPVVFANGNPVYAEELQTTFDSLREYLNTGILTTDVANDSVFTNEIVRGEYYNVVRDHQFTTGDLYTQFEEIDEFSRDYVGCQYKQVRLNKSLWIPIPNTGKRVVMEAPGKILYTVSIAAIANENYQLVQEKHQNYVFVVEARDDLIEQGDDVEATRGRYFTEDNVFTDVNNSGNTYDIGAYSRRWYCQRFYINATQAGVYNIFLATDVLCDKAYFSARNANVEVFYNGGT